MVFFLLWKQSFPCLTVLLHRSLKYGCILRTVRGTWNFVWQQATLVQGCTSEAHLNMDVNLCRLPDENSIIPKFLVPLAGIMWHPLLTDSADILSKQVKRQFIIKKNGLLRTVGISHPQKSNVHRMLQNFFILKNSPHSQAPMDYSGICPILV